MEPDPMNAVFRWLESTRLSVWTRESTSFWAYPAILSAHAIGMGLAAGVSAVVSLHVLGVAADAPTRELRRFRGVLWGGWWLNAFSGLLLLNAYPTKALTNPVFYVKLGLIAIALWLFVLMDRALADPSTDVVRWKAGAGRTLAIASLVTWAGAITAGRLLAYTYRYLLADWL
jgi:hypothetical protein